MDINPYEARLRMLQLQDGVQMQREAVPDEETAGCPGCPYFWSCPVPHRGEEIRSAPEVDATQLEETTARRRAFRPHDESDIGWTDRWVDEDGLHLDPEEIEEIEDVTAQDSAPVTGRRRRERRRLFRRR